MTEPPCDSRGAVFRALMDAVWAQAEGSSIEQRRKKSPVFGSRQVFENVSQTCSRRLDANRLHLQFYYPDQRQRAEQYRAHCNLGRG